MLALQLVLCLRSCCTCYNVSTAAAHVHLAKIFLLCPAVELNAAAAAHVHLAKIFLLCPAVDLNAGTAAGPAVSMLQLLQC